MKPKRYTSNKNLQVQSMDTGASQTALTIAKESSKLADIGFKKMEERAVSRGVSSAKSVDLIKDPVTGITYTPTFKKSGIIGSVADNAYNQTLRSAYVASVDTDMINAINVAYANNQDDIVGLNASLQGIRGGFAKAVDPSMRKSFLASFDSKATSVRGQSVRNTATKNKNISLSELNLSAREYSDEYSSAMYNSEPNAITDNRLKLDLSISQLIQSDPENKDKYVKFRNNSLKNGAIQAHTRTLNDTLNEKDGIGKAEELLNDWNKKTPEGLTPEEYQKVIPSFKAKVNWKKTTNKGEDKVRVNNQADTAYDMIYDGKDATVYIDSSDMSNREKEWYKDVQEKNSPAYRELHDAENILKSQEDQKRVALAKKDLEIKIDNELGTKTPTEMKKEYLRSKDKPNGLEIQELNTFIADSIDVMNNPSNFRRRPGFDISVAQLKTDKDNQRFHRGEKPADVDQNTRTYQNTYDEFVRLVSDPENPMKPKDAYIQVTEQYFEEDAKTLVQKVLDTLFGEKEESKYTINNKYPVTLSDGTTTIGVYKGLDESGKEIWESE